MADNKRTSDDCQKYLVDVFEKLKISKTKCPEVIATPYPGPLYRKTLDDSKVKVFQRGDTTKIYMYPSFEMDCVHKRHFDD